MDRIKQVEAVHIGQMTGSGNFVEVAFEVHTLGHRPAAREAEAMRLKLTAMNSQCGGAGLGRRDVRAHRRV